MGTLTNIIHGNTERLEGWSLIHSWTTFRFRRKTSIQSCARTIPKKTLLNMKIRTQRRSEGPRTADKLPAQLIMQVNGELLWLVDRDAASIVRHDKIKH
jgi:hypothetical protein